MATEIKMPQLGESVVEGTITKWLKQEGDSVSEDDLLVEVSTDKVDSEVPSSASGTLQKILIQEGETVKVGTPIAVVGEGEAPQEAAPEAEAGAEEQQQPAAQAEQAPDQAAGDGQAAAAEAEPRVSEQEGDGQPQGPAQPAEPAAADGQPAAEQGDRAEEAAARKQETGGGAPQPSPEGDGSRRGIISPLVRRLADEHSVNLEEVKGSGSGGRIRKQDVLSFVEARKQPAQQQPAAAEQQEQPAEKAAPEEAAPERAAPAREPVVISDAGAGRDELVPWTNIRRRTAEHMIASHLETARAWNAVEADWTDVVKLRAAAKDAFRQGEGFSLTYMPFLAKVLCETLLEMPEVNSTYDEDQQGNVVKHYVNLGIAVALEGGGLIVPVVKGADERNLTGLARAINDVATRARSKKLSPDDLSGGTFTITNPGPFGSVVSVPIIPRGQAAILGFETIEKRVVVTDDDSITIRSRGFLTMSWDHRAIDGAEAARFLARLKERVETTDFTTELQQYL
jgi:2-oxoglutarate dehydrogenase E2 component (dihydrolipoamide succinyltransferase)